MKKVTCHRCLGQYEDTLEGLEDHIFNSLEHDNYINMMRTNPGCFWK